MARPRVITLTTDFGTADTWIGQMKGVILGLCADAVVIDLSALRFMDCAGYGGLVAARLALESRGGSLTLLGSDGEPKRLLDLIAETEERFVAVSA